jgi:predicted Fe-Mo cluster-binding NifX family protein
MKAAFSVWNQRISPVFDASRSFLVLDIEDGEVRARQEEEFEDRQDPALKLARLAEMKVWTLVCGAISRPLADLAAASGIETFAFIAGEVEQVIDEFLAGGLPNPAMVMPGCRGRGGRCRRREMETRKQPEPLINEGQGRSAMPQGDGTGPLGQGPGTGKGPRGRQRSRAAGRTGTGAGAGSRPRPRSRPRRRKKTPRITILNSKGGRTCLVEMERDRWVRVR